MSISGIGANQAAEGWKPSPQASSTNARLQALERELQELKTEKQKAIQRKDQDNVKKLEKRIEEIEKQLQELQRKKADAAESAQTDAQERERGRAPSLYGDYLDELV